MNKRLLVMDGPCPGPECEPAPTWSRSPPSVTPAPGESLQEQMPVASVSPYTRIHTPSPHHTQLTFKQILNITHCALLCLHHFTHVIDCDISDIGTVVSI